MLDNTASPERKQYRDFRRWVDLLHCDIASASRAVSDNTLLALEQVRPIARELHRAQPSFVEFECNILRAELDECEALLRAIRRGIDTWGEVRSK